MIEEHSWYVRRLILVLILLVCSEQAFAIPPPGRRNFYATARGSNSWSTFHDSGYSSSWHDPGPTSYGVGYSELALSVGPTGFLDVAFFAGTYSPFIAESWIHTFAPGAGYGSSYDPPSGYTFEWSPSFVRTGPEITELFVVAVGGNLQNVLLHCTIDHTNVASAPAVTPWENWGSPPSSAIYSAPSGATWGPGRIDVFMRGYDGNLWHAYSVNGSRGWDNWGHPSGRTLAGDPATASWGDQRLDVFIRDTQGEILQAWFDHGSSGFGPWGNPTGVSFSSVGAAAFSVGEVYFGGLDQQPNPHLWLYRWANGPSSWEDLGPTPNGASDPPWAVTFAGTAY
jgi:hypothetical protein